MRWDISLSYSIHPSDISLEEIQIRSLALSYSIHPRSTSTKFLLLLLVIHLVTWAKKPTLLEKPWPPRFVGWFFLVWLPFSFLWKLLRWPGLKNQLLWKNHGHLESVILFLLVTRIKKTNVHLEKTVATAFLLKHKRKKNSSMHGKKTFEILYAYVKSCKIG